jgi:predicted ArsR family transcriptional regulator
VDELGDTTERILHFIQDNPGCHLRKIKENMDVSMGTVQYHLEKLEKMQRVVSARHGLYKHYFPLGIFHENEKEILQVLGQETSREILMFIIEQQAPTQTDIVNKVAHYCIPATGTDEFSLCTPDNITIIPKYRTADSLCYLVSRCNYCGKQWGEFWISYRYIFLPLIKQRLEIRVIGIASRKSEYQKGNGSSRWSSLRTAVENE